MTCGISYQTNRGRAAVHVHALSHFNEAQLERLIGNATVCRVRLCQKHSPGLEEPNTVHPVPDISGRCRDQARQQGRTHRSLLFAEGVLDFDSHPPRITFRQSKGVEIGLSDEAQRLCFAQPGSHEHFSQRASSRLDLRERPPGALRN